MTTAVAARGTERGRWVFLGGVRRPLTLLHGRGQRGLQVPVAEVRLAALDGPPRLRPGGILGNRFHGDMRNDGAANHHLGKADCMLL